jgi:hypothetical protein
LTKFFYYIITWNFDAEGRASMATPSQPTIQLTSGDSEQLDTIQQYNGKESHHTLGAWINPHLTMHTALKILSTTSSTCSRRLLTSVISPWEAWMSYFSVYLPQMRYTLAISPHSPRSLRKLQSTAVRANLLKLQFCRNTPLAVVYGPVEYGGLALPSVTLPLNKVLNRSACLSDTYVPPQNREVF